jgi:uncharacterized oligopeptide transporter (OPT) family protein
LNKKFVNRSLSVNGLFSNCWNAISNTKIFCKASDKYFIQNLHRFAAYSSFNSTSQALAAFLKLFLFLNIFHIALSIYLAGLIISSHLPALDINHALLHITRSTTIGTRVGAASTISQAYDAIVQNVFSR